MGGVRREAGRGVSRRAGAESDAHAPASFRNRGEVLARKTFEVGGTLAIAQTLSGEERWPAMRRGTWPQVRTRAWICLSTFDGT